jgi:hypothetical protein
MAQQPYMGPGLLLPPLFEVTKSCAFVAGGDWPTGRATCSIDPDVSARAIWQARSQQAWVRNGGFEFSLRNISIHARKVLLHAVNLRHGTEGFTSPPKEVVLRIFITLKNPSTPVGIEPANLGSSSEHANH